MSKKITDKIASLLIDRGESLAVAESVTAGDLQSAFSQAEKALDFFQGGITTYNIGQKTRHLDVDPVHADSCNCVSEKIAETMAISSSKLFCCNWGIGITGYASPVPEEGIEDLFACIAISFNDRILFLDTIRAEKAEPALVRLFYTSCVLDSLLTILQPKAGADI